MKEQRSRKGTSPPGKSGGLLKWAESADIRVVSLLPLLAALLLLAGALWLGRGVFGDPLPDWVIGLGTAAAAAVASVSGLVQAWRSEFPGPLGNSIHGAIARALGWALAVVCWAVALGEILRSIW